MNNKININQNIDNNIDLLMAQRYLYQNAKTYRTIRIFISIILSVVIAPILIFFSHYLKYI